MPKLDWVKLLERWSVSIADSGEYSDLLADRSGARKWAGFPPATDDAITATETRLQRRLPDSYRQFLKISNGWWLTGTAGPMKLWSVEEIRPLAEVQPETAAIWGRSAHGHRSKVDGTVLPATHYRSVIQISEDNDGFYLLNPLIETRPDEWQAAFHANWIPGAECHASFGELMSRLCEAYVAAHPPTRSKKTSARRRNLAKPPAEQIRDPVQFVDELKRLDYFRFAPSETEARMIENFRRVSEEFERKNQIILDGPYASPGAAILGKESGRVVELDPTRLATERGRYALAAVRQLLTVAGIELEPEEELITPEAYGVRLGDITHEFFRIRKGRPAVSGGDDPFNAARYVMYESVKLVNQILQMRESKERLATLEELQSEGLERPSTAQMRLAFVLLDDDLAYLLMWTPAIHNYCRPLRPDVIR
jgi:hypothetical protein